MMINNKEETYQIVCFDNQKEIENETKNNENSLKKIITSNSTEPEILSDDFKNNVESINNPIKEVEKENIENN